jgi:hypothetical protein
MQKDEGFQACMIRHTPHWPVVHFISREGSTLDTLREFVHPRPGIAHRWRAAALCQLNQTVQAKEALTKSLAASRTEFERVARQRPPWMRPEDYAHHLEGLRKAGWGGLNHPVPHVSQWHLADMS